MIKRLSYSERRFLRAMEGVWARGEGYVNRLIGPNGLERPSLNPLYHLGTLSIFLLIVLAVTGLYLTIFYRPGADRAYQSVAWISASWLGSLMRSVHRYAADGLLLTLVLHVLKMLLGDRFWGSRWLAWVSGWALLALIWLIGVMGYWLVWDQRAQWLTEYMISLFKGAVALAFITPEIDSRTFAFFVIILFLHVFLSVLIVVGLLVHVMRLARPRWWSPRELMIGTALVLTLIALLRPAASAPLADLNRLVGTITLDDWYLGFLKPTARWGSLPFWGLVGLLLAVLTALPWLARGRTLGPAVVTESVCTGCALCFQQCPYGAIEMKPRDDDAHYKSQAVVYPSLCTGCGLCVGTCSTAGAELAGLPTAELRTRLGQSLAAASASGVAPVVVFTCQRHASLGTLPAATVEEQRAGPALQPALVVSSWTGGNPHPRSLPLVTCPLPCAGMLQPEWVQESLDEGARAVLVVSCPSDDCSFREGSRWLAHRLERRHSLLDRGVYRLEVAPGDRRAVTGLLTRIAAETEGDRRPPATDHHRSATGGPFGLAWGRLRAMAVSLVLLGVVFGLALVAERPTVTPWAGEARLRVAVTHPGKFKAASTDIPPEVVAKLPAGVSPEQVLGGERYPVRLRVEVDGVTVIERFYRPRGLRREGTIFGLESWSLPPGKHEVRLWLMDDEATWRLAFDGPVDVAAGQVRTLSYDEEQETFVLR